MHPGAVRETGDVPGWWTAVVDYTSQMQMAYFHWLAERDDSMASPDEEQQPSKRGRHSADQSKERTAGTAILNIS